jgi:hypothetical protein
MRTHGSDEGFSLAALIFFLSAASIFIAAAVPSYQMQAKREMEEELIFRGEEYARAIQKYQRRFGVYPSTVDQLVSTNGLRFLRRAYKDPMTGKDFRLLTINPDGSVTGSKVLTRNTNTQSLFGNPQMFGQQQNPQQQFQQAPQAFQQFPQTQQPIQQQRGQAGFPTVGQQQQQAFQAGAVNPSTAPRGQQQQQQFSSFGQPAQQRGQQPGTIPGIGAAAGMPVASGGIIGVASDSDQDSIKVYNTRQKYDEWEFLAILAQQQGQRGQAQNPQQPQNPQNPQQPQVPSPFGSPAGPRTNTPFQNPSPNPFGPQPGTSPFGVGPGQGQTPSPFGFGGTPQQQLPPQPRK